MDEKWGKTSEKRWRSQTSDGKNVDVMKSREVSNIEYVKVDYGGLHSGDMCVGQGIGEWVVLCG